MVSPIILRNKDKKDYNVILSRSSLVVF